jgi:hypothetical protein
MFLGSGIFRAHLFDKLSAKNRDSQIVNYCIRVHLWLAYSESPDCFGKIVDVISGAYLSLRVLVMQFCVAMLP